LRRLRKLNDTVTSVMVVGHNPTAQALALGLLDLSDKEGRDDVVRRGFPTCALGVYRLDIARWADIEGQCASLVALFIPPFEKD
jgi:phosphohistidine phosphatase